LPGTIEKLTTTDPSWDDAADAVHSGNAVISAHTQRKRLIYVAIPFVVGVYAWIASTPAKLSRTYGMHTTRRAVETRADVTQVDLVTTFPTYWTVQPAGATAAAAGPCSTVTLKL